MNKNQKGFSVVVILIVLVLLVAVAYFAMNLIGKNYGVDTLNIQIPTTSPY